MTLQNSDAISATSDEEMEAYNHLNHSLNTTGSSIPSLVDLSLLADSNPGEKVIKAAHRIYEHLIALWAPAIIEASQELGVFRALAEKSADSISLSNILQTDARSMRILLNALYAYGVVERIQDASGVSLYTLPREFQHCLLPGELYSLAGKMVYDQRLAWDAWRNLANSVRTGSTDQSGSVYRQNQIADHDYEFLVSGINFWAPPAVVALCRGLRQLEWDTDAAVSILDVGCGTGLYSQLLLQHFTHWTALGLDCERIAPQAQAQSIRLGVDARFTCRVCDFWQDRWEDNIDLLLFANIFHLQTYASAQRLITLASQSLSPGGLVCIIDHIVDDDCNVQSPQSRFALLFAASMLATGGGDTYTLSDYDRWLEAAKLQRLCVLDTPMHRILIAARA
ncbi:MAG TPA: class I SAM-dependent methyltransferase [Ktedonobacteraceae bacterium]|jgi:SAM-dependent methyltransferase|nr:class I SAM-dependent methyltransferase [Ktedonobacteraceae bacterium]